MRAEGGAASAGSTPPGRKTVVVGVDTGGTFTDCILVGADGSVELAKIPSRPDRPDAAILDGLDRLLGQSRVAASAINHVGHGTTVATNTVIEESGAKVGVLVTQGFRDSLFLRRVRFPNPANLNGPLPRELVRRADVREIGERMDVDGNVVRPLAVEEAVEAARDLVEARGVSALAICFLHAYRNPAHEIAVREAVEARFPDVFVTISSDISPRPREYERFMTTVLNAYVGARMKGYLTRLEEGARSRGIGSSVLVTKSDGGILNIETAGSFPVHTMLSGPAAGVVAAHQTGLAAGFDKLVTWDMGGTSLDVAVIDGRIRYTDEAAVGEHPLFIPTVDVISIGAGGGSIAWVDAGGMLNVGPRSAGAMPGPACYGRGGTEATLTDAYVALGIVHPDLFAGGEIPLDRDRSLAALAALGGRLGLDALAAAEAILEVATAQTQAKCMPLLARYGIDPAEFTLVAYGGAGPTHCFLYAAAAGIGRVLVPLYPGLLCALGTIIADLRFDVPKRAEGKLGALDIGAFNAELDALGRAAMDKLAAQNVAVSRSWIDRSVFMRYVGQSFEVEVPVPEGAVAEADLRRLFGQTYQARYGYSDAVSEVEVVSVTARAVGQIARPKVNLAGRTLAQAESGRRAIHIGGRWRDIPALDRRALRPGETFAGPLVIDQADTTTFVPEGFDIRVDDQLNIIGEARP